MTINDEFTNRLKAELDALWRFAIRLSNDRGIAEDLVQKTIVRSLEKKQQFVDDSNFRSWLFKIQHSIWKNDLREKAIRDKVSFNTVDINEVISNESHSDQNLFFKEVMNQLNQLPEAQRITMILVCIDGYSYKETAAILDVAEGTIMSRVARARLKIGQAFNDTTNSMKSYAKVK